MKLVVSKGLRKICSVILILLILMLSATSCNFRFISDIDSDPCPSILNSYSKTERSVFLKLEIVNIYDEVFIDQRDIAFPYDSGKILLECKVLDDLYESGVKPNEKIIIPIFLTHTFLEGDDYVRKDLPLSDVKTLLSSFDCIYIKTERNSECTYVVKDSTETSVKTVFMPCDMSLYDILPSVDNKVCINLIEDFFNQKCITNLPYYEIVYMDSFCYEGISCEEFENNVRELSAYFDSKYENNK